MAEIAVVDYQMGNLRSVAKALEHVAADASVVVTDDPARIEAADRVVFPGQGAIGDCMRELDRRGLIPVIREVALTRPFLGICLGLQALFDESEEDGGTPGLGVIPGTVPFFGHDLTDPDTGLALKVPHMGWNQVQQVAAHPLWEGIADGSRFYFVHSYYVEPAEPAPIAGVTSYGISFTAAVAQGTLFAMQFHPEKSQRAGLKLLANFVRWDGSV